MDAASKISGRLWDSDVKIFAMDAGRKKCCGFELWLQPVASPVCYWIRVSG